MKGKAELWQYPSISVCIANYNGEQLLDACIESVRAQEYAGAVEILVHDDASTDESLRVLAERHSDVIVISSLENVGYCHSNNRLARRATGDYLLLLNNDATLRSMALNVLVNAGRNLPAFHVLTLPQYDHTTGNLVDRGVRLDVLHTPFANQCEGYAHLAYVQGACMFIRRDVWMELGGFPGWMVSNAEDTYLCALMRLRRGYVGVVEGSGYDHRQGASFGGNRTVTGRLATTYRRRYLSERNRVSLMLVCTPTPAAWFLYAMQLAFLLLEGGVVSLLKSDRRPWVCIYGPAVRDSMKMLEVLRSARREVQSHSQIGFFEYFRGFRMLPWKITVLLKKGLPELS